MIQGSQGGITEKDTSEQRDRDNWGGEVQAAGRASAKALRQTCAQPAVETGRSQCVPRLESEQEKEIGAEVTEAARPGVRGL